MYAQRHTVFDASTEKKHQSEYIWSSRAAKILLLVGIFGIAASSFAATPDSLDVNAFDPKKPAIAQAKGFNKKLKDKAPRYKKAHPNKQSQDQDKSIDKAQIIHDIKERKAAIKAAIATNPESIAEAALPQDVKDALPDEVKGDVEQAVEVSGHWVTGHTEPIPGSASGYTPLVQIVTEDYHHVGVYGEALPTAPSTTPVIARGIKLDTELAVTSTKRPDLSSNTHKSLVSRLLTTPKAYAQLSPNVEFCHDYESFLGTGLFEKDVMTPECAAIISGHAPNNLDDNPTKPAVAKKVLFVPIKFKGDPTVPIRADGRPLSKEDIQDLVTKNQPNSESFASALDRMSYGSLRPSVSVIDWVTLDDNNNVDCSNSTGANTLTNNVQDEIHDKITDGDIDARGVTNIVYLYTSIKCKTGDFQLDELGDSYVGQNDPKIIMESDIFLDRLSGAIDVPIRGANNIEPLVVKRIFTQTLLHEFGHAMGLNHAYAACGATPSSDCFEYGDQYDVMGRGLTSDGFDYNAFHKWQLGWTKPQDVVNSGDYTISQMKNTGATASRSLRIPVTVDPATGATKTELYLEYLSGGPFNVSPGATNTADSLYIMQGVLVHEVSAADPYNSSGNAVSTALLQANSQDVRFRPASSGGILTCAQVGLPPGCPKDTPQPARFEYIPLSSTDTNRGGYSRAAMVKAGDSYKYQDPSNPSAQPVCVKLNNDALSTPTVSVRVVMGCGTPNPTLNPADSLGTMDTLGHETKQNETQLKDSNGVCLDDVSHRLFVADTHKILEYDLDPATNLLKDHYADHVLGADSIGSYVYTGSPIEGIDQFTYSARWSGKFMAPTTGSYTFQTYSDDGVRLWVNNTLLIDNWTDHPPTTNKSNRSLTLTAGAQNDIKVEFYQNYGQSTLQLKWSGPGINGQVMPASAFVAPGLAATYYDNKDFTGAAKSRTDPNIDNPWGFAPSTNAPTYADAPGSPVRQNTISWSNSRITCDPKNNRLFVANNDTNYGTTRILIFDFKNGFTNGMNASYVLGQKDFTSSDSKYSTKKADFYQANTFSLVGGMAYSSNRNMLFVASQSTVSRVLAFDLNKVANNMNASYVFGQPTGVFTEAGSTPTALFGGPANLAIDEAKDTLYINSYNFGNRLYAQNIAAAMLDGKSYLPGTYIALPTITSGVAGGPMALTEDRNSLYYMSSSTSAGQPVNVYDVSAPSATKKVSSSGVITLNQVGTSLSIAMDYRNKLLYAPFKNGGRVLIYPLPFQDNTDWSKAVKTR